MDPNRITTHVKLLTGGQVSITITLRFLGVASDRLRLLELQLSKPSVNTFYHFPQPLPLQHRKTSTSTR